MRQPVLEPLFPVLVEAIFEKGSLAGLPPMHDLVQHLVPPPARLLGIFFHRVADDAGAHRHHCLVGVAGDVIGRVGGEGALLLVLGPIIGFGGKGGGACVVHVHDEVCVALDDVVV